MFKRLLFWVFSALVTMVVALLARRLTSLAYTRAMGRPPPED